MHRRRPRLQEAHGRGAGSLQGGAPRRLEARPASEAALRGKWWELFGDPALNALEEQVSVSNQTLAQAEAQFRRRPRRGGAGPRRALFPTVTACAQGSRAYNSTSGRTSNGTTTGGSSTVYQVPIDFTWELDLWGRVRRGIEANIATAQRAPPTSRTSA